MDIKIIKSRRKTLAIEITKDLRVIVRAPLSLPDGEIQKWIAQKSRWVEKALEKVRAEREKAAQAPKLTQAELHALAEKAIEVIPERAAYYAQKMGVRYGRITIRNQVSRWGSCSAKGNLNFNCLLMLCPKAVIDYVVVHELCRLREMNHSKRFWALAAEFCPAYARHRKWLKEHGGGLIERLRP